MSNLSEDHDRWLAWHGALSDSRSIGGVDFFLLHVNGALWHREVLENIRTMMLNQLFLVEWSLCSQSCVFAKNLGVLNDEGSKFHCQSELLAGEFSLELSDVISYNRVILIEFKLFQDLKSLLLPFREFKRDENSAVLKFLLSISFLALLGFLSSSALLERQMHVALDRLQEHIH